jgi:hypothetical protein
LVVLLLSYGAAGARQPAVRSSVPLPAPAADLAEALGLPSTDRSRILLDIVRLAFDAPDGHDDGDARLRARLNRLIESQVRGETAPLPLDPSIWRDTLLHRDVPDDALLAAVLSERRTALLYYGLSALDDETLGAIGPDRSLLTFLGEHAGPFAAFGRSLRIKAGHVQVPGGPDASRIWAEIVGADPAQPSEFARRLFSRSRGQLAFFYDTVAHLDEPSLRFALSEGRVDKVQTLAETFGRSAVELRPMDRPFSRQYPDPALTLAAIEVANDGRPVGPSARGLWEAVFKADERPDQPFKEVTDSRNLDMTAIDGAWIMSRIHRHSTAAARRRLETFLFAQRVFRAAAPNDSPAVITALRGMLAFPALMLTLERAGVTDPKVFAAAAVRVNALNTINDGPSRRTAIAQFQAALGILERMVLSGGLTPQATSPRIASLLAIDFADGRANARFAEWVLQHLVPSSVNDGDLPSMEAAVLSAIAGRSLQQTHVPSVEWEGRLYRVDAAAAEFIRLRRVRGRQGGPSLDEALGKSRPALNRRDKDEKEGSRSDGNVSLAQVLTSILYAAHLGEPESTALAGGNVALRHDFGIETGPRPNPLQAWRIASESFGAPNGWLLRGSLLGLEVPLARFALKRLDVTVMPPPPKLTSNERHTAALTVALMRPHQLADSVRDEIAAALARGRARLAALTADREDIERLARDGGMSEWRREALAWTVVHDRARVDEQISLLELFWLGAPARSAYSGFDRWGAAMLPLTGCLCLSMPRAEPWELLAGRPSAGILATRGADVSLLVAETLARLRLPAALAAGVMSFAMQDVLDRAQPAYFDDWSQFGRAAMTISESRAADYVAALTAGGPLLPAGTANGKHP